MTNGLTKAQKFMFSLFNQKKTQPEPFVDLGDTYGGKLRAEGNN
jgi:hypothetical protein